MDIWEEQETADFYDHPDLAIGQECPICGYVKKALGLDSERGEE